MGLAVLKHISTMVSIIAIALGLNACDLETPSIDINQITQAETPDSKTISSATAERVIVHANGDIETVAANCITKNWDGAMYGAVQQGRADLIVKESQLLNALTETIICEQTRFNDARIVLFDLNADGSTHANSLTNISWDPTHDAAHILPSFGQNETVLVSNAVTNAGYPVKTRSLAIAGETGASRYMVMGSHPFRQWQRGFTVNDDMQQFMRNSLTWLTRRSDLTSEPFNVVIAHNDQSYYFPDRSATENWLDAEYPGMVSYNTADSCNSTALAACLTGNVDLLIISQKLFSGDDVGAVQTAVSDAMDAGIPVLYMHHDGGFSDLGRALFPLFDVTYQSDNYWYKLQLSAYDGSTGFATLPDDVSATRVLINRFRDDSFTIDLSQCDDKTCPAAANYDVEFLDTVTPIRTMIDGFDQSKTDLFKQQGYTYQKLLLLLADRYRQSAGFPMDKNTTPRPDFLKSYFADSLVHIFREHNPGQSDLGNFSRSSFSHITPVSRSITMPSKTDYMATGFYALPGQTFTVTRTDSEPVTTHIRINLLRSGATHEFETDGYKRPKYLSSQNIPIAPGETMNLTSPYGGPIFVKFDQAGLDTGFTFGQIGEHAIWRSAADDTEFANRLAANEYDWAELITPAFQVHSKIEKMNETVSNPRWGNAAGVGAATEKHLHNYPHVLAGYQGAGVDVVAEIHDFATTHGLTVHTLDKVKHMNADQANCGYGCSGNPYDAYWAFDPLGHGDIHELGHGLERSRFRFTGQPGHTGTNPYSYYSKWKYYQETSDLTVLDGCQSLPFESLFNTIQASRNEADPFAYMQSANLTAWNQGAAINIQIAMSAQNEGLLVDGWHYLARLHIVERDFSIADNNETEWLARRDGLGFGGMSYADMQSLDNNDWNLVALSHVLDRDMTTYLTYWGFAFSTTAKTHVAGQGQIAMPVNFYVTTPNGFCTGLDNPSLPIDGQQNWPVLAERPKSISQLSAARANGLTKPPQSDQLAAGHICNHGDGL